MKTIIVLLMGLALATVCPAETQQPKKIPRVGFLAGASGKPNLRGLRQGLRELGYVEGKNIIIEYRVSEGEFDPVTPLPLNWFASRLTLLSHRVRQRLRLPRMQLARSHSLCQEELILLPRDSFSVLLDQGEVLRASPS